MILTRLTAGLIAVLAVPLNIAVVALPTLPSPQSDVRPDLDINLNLNLGLGIDVLGLHLDKRADERTPLTASAPTSQRDVADIPSALVNIGIELGGNAADVLANADTPLGVSVRRSTTNDPAALPLSVRVQIRELVDKIHAFVQSGTTDTAARVEFTLNELYSFLSLSSFSATVVLEATLPEWGTIYELVFVSDVLGPIGEVLDDVESLNGKMSDTEALGVANSVLDINGLFDTLSNAFKDLSGQTVRSAVTEIDALRTKALQLACKLGVATEGVC